MTTAPLARAEAAAALWPDSSEVQARTNLRGAMHRLLGAVPALEHAAALAGPDLGWRSGGAVDADLWRFRRAVGTATQRSLEAAVALYRGDLLPGRAEEWAVRARQECRAAYGQALERLADLAEGARRYAEALRYAERLHRDDPLSEEHLRRLMRAHALCGDPGGVERAYRRGHESLSQELGCEPSPATQELYRRLRAPSVRRDGPRQGVPDGSLGERLRRAESDLFVGRAAEMERFRRWLLSDADDPALLVVRGPGGVGKSTLLRAWADMARRLGNPVLLIDARRLAGSPQSLLAALGGDTEQAVVARLNRLRPTLVFDTCEDLAGLGRYLREGLLPRLDGRIRMVFAGRFGAELAWRLDAPWRRVLTTVTLQGFSTEESQEYLRRRGIADPSLAVDIAAAAGGNPLGLSLAADLLVDLGVRDLRAALPRWRLTVHELAGYLVRDVPDAHLRSLLEAASVLREFDASALARVSGQPEARAAFGQLARLSVVRPAEHGLALHDDVRRILAADVEWREPDRWAALRRRALDHYRERAEQVAGPEERQWVFNERLALWSHALARRMLAHEPEPGLLWVEAGQPEDWPAVRRIWREWVTHSLRAEPAAGLQQALECSLRSRCFRLQVVRHRSGDILGFSGAVAVCRESLPILRTSPNTAALVRARWSLAELRDMPATPDATRFYHLRYAAYGAREADAVRVVLIRELLAMLTLGGCYFVTTGHPDYQALAEALGFRRLDGARHRNAGAAVPDESYELDLTRRGFEAWLAELVLGRVLDPESGAESSPRAGAR